MHVARHGHLRLVYETSGPVDGAPLLLIGGLGAQLLAWPDEFCTLLGERGFRVARFDNRDAGLSTHLTGVPAPGWIRSVLHRSSAPYRLEDMADDTVAVLDALGWPSAHVVGASMGGMIAQTLAVRAPDRVRTLTSIRSTPSAWIGTIPAPRTLLGLIRMGANLSADEESSVKRFLAMRTIIGSAGALEPDDVARALARRAYLRSADRPDGTIRQRAAIIASGDRRAGLRKLRVPTLVIHGDRDPLVRPIGGRATAAAIPGARLVVLPGIGHDLPSAVWSQVADEIAALAGLLSGGRAPD